MSKRSKMAKRLKVRQDRYDSIKDQFALRGMTRPGSMKHKGKQ